MGAKARATQDPEMAEAKVKKAIMDAYSAFEDARAKVDAGIYEVPGGNTGSLWSDAANEIDQFSSEFKMRGIEAAIAHANTPESLKFLETIRTN